MGELTGGFRTTQNMQRETIIQLNTTQALSNVLTRNPADTYGKSSRYV